MITAIKIHDLTGQDPRQYMIKYPHQALNELDRSAAETALEQKTIITMGQVIAEPITTTFRNYPGNVWQDVIDPARPFHVMTPEGKIERFRTARPAKGVAWAIQSGLYEKESF